MKAYCVKCHAKRELRSIKSITLKNGRPAIQGVCPVCGTRVYRIVKSRDTIATVVVRAVNKSWPGRCAARQGVLVPRRVFVEELARTWSCPA